MPPAARRGHAWLLLRTDALRPAALSWLGTRVLDTLHLAVRVRESDETEPAECVFALQRTEFERAEQTVQTSTLLRWGTSRAHTCALDMLSLFSGGRSGGMAIVERGAPVQLRLTVALRSWR
jgi:hypothetical protein